MVFARVRKAVIAGVGAGIAAGVASLVQAGTPTRDEMVKALGVALVAAITVGWATYKVPNAEPA